MDSNNNSAHNSDSIFQKPITTKIFLSSLTSMLLVLIFGFIGIWGFIFNHFDLENVKLGVAIGGGFILIGIFFLWRCLDNMM